MSKILFLALAVLTVSIAASNCQQGSVLIDGSCTKCGYIPGCAQYGKYGKCQICQFGYYLSDGRCDYDQTPNAQCCTSFDGKGNCQKCAPGLYLERNSCYKIQRPGCLEGDQNSCKNCADSYIKIEGRCVRQIEQCLQYRENGVCSKCSQGYNEIYGLCIPVISVPNVPNCALNNQYGCISCEDNFYLTQQNHCHPFKAGCFKYFKERCQFCLSDYKLIEGECFIQGCVEYGSKGCSKCESSYILKNGKCSIENCFESLKGVCLTCDEGYRISKGKCVKPITRECKECGKGFFVGSEGNCIQQIAKCKVYQSQGKCKQCIAPFTLDNNRCIIPNCQKYSANACSTCKAPFEVNSKGLCAIVNCEIYDDYISRCQVCKPDYHLKGSKCVPNNRKCQKYEKQNNVNEICVKCYVGYILNGENDCVVQEPGCVYQYGKCISCAHPFQRVNQRCVIEGCFEYTLDGCSKCSSPFELIRGNCAIPYCSVVKDGKCIKCDYNHFLKNGVCIENDPKCSAYQNDKCVGCISGYIFSNGLCVRNIPNCKVLGVNSCKECDIGYQENYGECVPTDPNCLKSNKLGCEECKAGYYTKNGRCQSNDPNCKIYSAPSNNQSCQDCKDGYVFSAKGAYCVKKEAGCIYSNGVCTSCSKPFIYNPTKSTCSISGCHKYYENGCYTCAYPMKENNGECVILFCSKYDWDQNICEQCQGGYKLIQGLCYREDPKCVSYTQKGVCKLCIKEYQVFEGVCIKEDKYCENYSSQKGGCNKCKNGYYLSPDSVCLPEEPGCIYQKGKCSLCRHPFSLNQLSQKCRIDGCLEASSNRCQTCRFPFESKTSGVCQIPNCSAVKDNACTRCTYGFHVKEGLYCVKNDPNCLQYNEDGDCEQCTRGYLLMSNGQCEVAEDNCVESTNNGKCIACKPEFFLNRFFQCQKRDINCEVYNNGACSTCKQKFFLYEYICFPYTPGCVKYSGKDCISCRSGWQMRKGECFNLKKPLLKSEGEDEHYDFEINQIDITKSKYYIDNLSPCSKLGDIVYSSFFNKDYTKAAVGTNQDGTQLSKGWKSEHQRSGEYIGCNINEGNPVTFYAIQMEATEGSYIKTFYIEYSLDGINFIRIEKLFDSSKCQQDLITIYFTPIYAKAIRIIVVSYVGWPAAKFEVFYYDELRYRKISSLKSLRYLKESIQSNFVDRMDNQLYINQRFYFRPSSTCSDNDKAGCFTGFELCQARTIRSFNIYFPKGLVSQIYLTYSINGYNYNCFEKCRVLPVSAKDKQFAYSFKDIGLLAQSVRIYPVKWEGDAEMKVTYDYN